MVKNFDGMFIAEIISKLKDRYSHISAKVLGENSILKMIFFCDDSSNSCAITCTPCDLKDYINGIPNFNGLFYEWPLFYRDGFVTTN